MRKDILSKTLVMGVIVLFVGVSVCPSISGYDEDFERKDYQLNENLIFKNEDYNNLIKQSMKSGVISNNNWFEFDKLLAPDGATYDRFGISVSIDGEYAIIGAPFNDFNGPASGSAYIFTRTGTTWTLQLKLLASDGTGWDQFGSSVSIDDDTALIGAPYDDDNGYSSGSAYVFIRSGNDWTEQGKLLASDGAPGDWFGSSVSIYGDTAIIGEPGDNYNGSAYIFTRSGSVWTEQAKLLASDGAAGEWFGISVSIDGDTAIIGDNEDDDNGVNSGSAYIFTRSGTVWTEQAKLLASDGATYDQLGISVSIDEDYAIIGANLDDDNGNMSGSAYVFRKDNQQPNKPTIHGPITGKPGVEYTYFANSTDPERDQIFYKWSWGDNSYSEWLGPYDSGLEVSASHAWSQGTFNITVKAKDVYGLESDWSDPLIIKMPRDKALNRPLLQFLENHPYLFPLLQKLLLFIK